MGYLVRLALIVGAAALFAGCGVSQPPIEEPGALPQSRAIADHANRGGSWMLPEASSDDLLYAIAGCHQVTGLATCVLSYPQGKIVGTLDNAGAAICSDGHGNVFMPFNGTVTEYAHGGTTPIATLNLPGTDALGCAVDPVTNNLAVLFDGSGKNVAIFPNESGTPALYAAVINFRYCAYDSAGNLFVNGYSGSNPGLAELPYGGTSFSNISVSNSVGYPGQMQWDGHYLTYEGVEQGDIKVSQLSVSDSEATIVGTTKLNLFRATASWIFGNRIIVPHAVRRNLRAYTTQISYFKYPQGGVPSKTIKNFSGFKKIDMNFQGVTVSVAPSR